LNTSPQRAECNLSLSPPLEDPPVRSISNQRESESASKHRQHITFQQNRTTRDGMIALGLCEENSVLLMYDGLIWIPDNDTRRLRILRDHHDVQAVGHPGRARTLELVSRNFYRPRQRKDVHRYVDHCDTCHRIKPI